ncbi:hypothetical protein ACFE04_004656 [Oxalis oulophora]
MLSLLQMQSLHSPPLILSSSSLSIKNSFKTTRKTSSLIVGANKEKDSEQFQVDRDKAKAREALQKLDQQFQTLSNRQPQSPKIKASDVKIVRPEVVQQAPEFSASFFAYFAGALFIFTIFYNVLFYSVIKPSIEGPRPTLSDAPKERLFL